ncbi:MAG: bifunctional phosphopantothenoylcysteine decarboxylase/phosphopantothenate--cysteine ligase CoaBC [Thermoplasmatota archaeon]
MTHPSDDLRGSSSDKLRGKTVVLGVTGSIAAVESVKLARELTRHGARVIPVMSTAACRILHPDALWFATGTKPVTDLTGDVEHVRHCGQRENQADMLLVAPCTANTLSKIALGIDDTPVTTMATTAVGSGLPVLLVPAMHAAMYDNPFVRDNLQRCREQGIHLAEPRRAEGKAKMPEMEDVVARVLRLLGKNDWAEKRVLVVGGATAEYLDPVRVLTNRSSGKMALALATAAYQRGAEVELWHHGLNPPAYLSSSTFTTSADLVRRVQQAGRYHCIINCAAITDFTCRAQEKKMASGQSLDLHLEPVPRINPLLREHANLLVGFKLETDRERALERAWETLHRDGLDYVVANTTASLGGDDVQAWIIDREKNTTPASGSKPQVADRLLDLIR